MTRRPIGVKTILPALAAVLAMTLAACGDDPTSTASDEPAALSLDDLDGRTFASVQVDGHRLVGDTRIRIGFTGEELSADAGCNHLFGTAALDGDTLTVGNLGGTEMGCPDGLNDQDAWLTEFLGSGPTATLVGETLTLTGADVVIELVELAPADEATGDPGQPTADSDEGTSNDGE